MAPHFKVLGCETSEMRSRRAQYDPLQPYGSSFWGVSGCETSDMRSLVKRLSGFNFGA